MKNLLFGLVGALLILTTSCTKDRITGSGSTTTDNRAINGFTAVRSNGSSSVTIEKGNTFNVEVKGYGNLLPYFDTKVVNGTLVLGYRDNVHIRNSNTEVTVTMPTLNGLHISGSGNIISKGDFTGNTNFETTIEGSGNITIQSGHTKFLSTRISGSGDIYAFGFSADKADVQVSGSGNTRLTANAQLNIKIAGSGNVYYKGSPELSVNVSGSGDVVKQ